MVRGNGGETGNGYINRQEFIDLLKFAHQRAIKIMPQISFPSHARAAIKAMDHRYENPQVHENKDEIKAINSPIRTIKVNTDLLKITMTISSVSVKKVPIIFMKK